MYGGSLTSRDVKIRKLFNWNVDIEIHRHEKIISDHPPSHGPIVGATTTATPYTANAMPRFSTGKRIVQDRLLAGLQSAAADSLKNSQKDQSAEARASPQKNELTVNNATDEST